MVDKCGGLTSYLWKTLTTNVANCGGGWLRELKQLTMMVSFFSNQNYSCHNVSTRLKSEIKKSYFCNISTTYFCLIEYIIVYIFNMEITI